MLSLLSKVIPRTWVLSLLGMIWFLSVNSMGSSFLFLLFLNTIFIVLLVEKVLSVDHASDFLVTPCSALANTLGFLVVIYIARKKVTLSSPPCGTPGSVYLFCDIDPLTLTLIYLSLISFLINSIICFYIPCSPVV